MYNKAALPMSENDLLKLYNTFCKIWEFEADGKVDALVRKNMIKGVSHLDSLLIDNMNKKGIIKNLGEENYYGFILEAETFDTHLYLADVDNDKKVVVSVAKPIFTSSKWINIVIADKKYFCLDVGADHLGTVINYFASLFAACFSCQTEPLSRGLKYLYREILANIFVGSVTNTSVEDIRKYSNDGGYFTDEFDKIALNYNKEILSTMQKGRPYIPVSESSYSSEYATNRGKLNDTLIIMSLLEYKQLRTKKEEGDSEDYGDETSESSDSV